jgi:hypothetical protein
MVGDRGVDLVDAVGSNKRATSNGQNHSGLTSAVKRYPNRKTATATVSQIISVAL